MQLKKYKLINSDIMIIERCDPAFVSMHLRRVWRYKSGNPNPYIKDEQTTQWQKEIVQKEKQRSTNMHIKLKFESH
jgi:hypothetical protein